MEKVYLYITTPLGDKFLVDEIVGEEQLSGLFHYRVKLKSEAPDLDFSQIVGKNATVTIVQRNEAKRFINGVVCRFIQAGSDGNITVYYADVRPWLWQLTLASNSKIFQQQTALDIIKAVFADAGFTDFEDRTVKSYTQREYCVQYQETAFNFVSRLMEDEGVFYFFEHSDGTHKLIMADDTDAHQPCPGLEYARMRYASSMDRLDDNFITQCRFEEQMIPTQYAADDFNFKTPDSDLLTSADGKADGNFRVYEYPGNFEDSGQGEPLTDKRIESLELPQKLLKGQGVCRAFISGYKFDFKEHERDDLNTSYVIKNLFIRADQNEYTNTFEAFPADVPFRPPRTMRKPRIVGTQTAIVTGKKGEEIWPDEYGRIKVQFHWDQDGAYDENTSCWVRVTQMWAGKNWGTLFIPRIGAEVIVSFLEGDPDRPIVTGTVYNASYTVPYSLPGEKTKSTMKTNSSLGGGGFNEIRFEDKKGSEEIFTHAQKDQNEVVENNMTTTVKANQSIQVDKNKNELVKINKSESIGVAKELSIGRLYQVSVGEAKNETVGKAKAVEVGKDYTIKVGGDLTIDVKGKVTIKGCEIHLNP